MRANIRSLFVVAHLTFHEARRKRVLLAALVLGLAFLLLFGIGFNLIYVEMQHSTRLRGASALMNDQFLNFISLAGLYAVNFLGIMMSGLLPVDTLAGEIRSGMIQSLVTKPARRWAIVLGKWLGFWVMIVLYLALMAGGVIGIVYALSGTLLANAGWGLLLMLLEATIVLSISIAGGTYFSTLANGVVVFGLFGFAFIGGWVERIGSTFGNKSAEQIGVISSLIMPTEALWQLAAYHMQPTILRQLGLSPFSSTSEPSPLMVIWAFGMLITVLVIALRQFNQRDL